MTSHHFIEKLQEKSKGKIINAIEESANVVSNRFEKVKKAGILASTGAIKLELFQKQLVNRNIEPIILNDNDQHTYFMEPIYAEWGIKAGNFTGKPKERFNEAVRILSDQGAEVLIAGCSELPLVLNQDEIDIPMIDANEILARKAVEFCFGAVSEI